MKKFLPSLPAAVVGFVALYLVLSFVVLPYVAKWQYEFKNPLFMISRGGNADIVQKELEVLRQKGQVRRLETRCVDFGYLVFDRIRETAVIKPVLQSFEKACFSWWEWHGPRVFGLAVPVARVLISVIGPEKPMAKEPPFSKSDGIRYVGYEFVVKLPGIHIGQ